MTTPPPLPNPRSPSADETDEPADRQPAATDPDYVDKRRKRRLVVGGVVAAAVLVVAACASAVVGVVKVADAVDGGGRDRVRVGDACQALEVRLNRVAPPGAAAGPRERATAIRNENAAVRPFLDELGRVAEERLARRWTALVAARTSYADALDRQAASGAPAFFVAPVDERGRPVVDRLAGRDDDCAASIRRLAAPDL